MGGVRPAAQRETGGGERPRLFVAVLLPDAWLDALAAAQERLRGAGLRLRYVRPEGIHLTLKFLGETPAERLTRIERALEEAAADAAPCTVALGPAGFFGPRRRPRVVWQGVEGDLAALAAVQGQVDQALARAGFAAERRSFSPHLTLARVPDDLPPAEAERIAPAVERLSRADVAPLSVGSLALMRSELGRGGARYAELGSWRIGGTSDR